MNPQKEGIQSKQMITIDMDLPFDCQSCRFCFYAETAKHCGNVCTATENWRWLDGDYDKPKWCPVRILQETIHCKDCKYYKRVYNNIGCEMINFSGCEKGHGGYPNWSCADAEKAVLQCKRPYQWKNNGGEIG